MSGRVGGFMTHLLLVHRGVRLVVAGREHMVSLTGYVSTVVGPTELGSAEVGFADVSSPYIWFC